ncbi:MAG: hypothetical protein GEV03_23255 [Streptosporangiales bacterium]|nr:hypothetical protein [Streptosporangiales bacterium]
MCTTGASEPLAAAGVAAHPETPLRRRADSRRAGHQHAPAVIVPAHCTGWVAQQVFAERFPDAFIPNTVGTRFEL